MASTEVTPKACRFGPARESAQAVIAAALGETCLSATDWLSLCRSDPAVLLAWLGHDEVGEALPILPGDSDGDSNKRRHSKLDESSSRNAWHILARWADWQPTWFPDWSQPRLSGFRQAIHLAGMLARQVAPRLALQPDLAEAAARVAGIGQFLIAAKKVGRRTPGGGWIRLAAHWSLPPSLRQIWSRLDAPLAFFTRQDSEEKLLRLVQVVWQLAQGRFRLKSAWSGPPLSDLLATLELDAGDFPCDEVPELPPLSPIGSDWLWTELGRLLKETASARQQLQFVERECQRWQRQAIQLAQQQQELLQQHKLRSLAAFAAGAGHELGSPLAVISGYAEQLLRQEKQLERIQALERILAQTRRIHALVLDLMFFARPPEPKKRRLRLDRLLRQVVGRFVCEAEQKQITLSCTCPDQAISMVADGSLLQTAIECLLRNALEAAPQGGRVSCSVVLLDSDQVQVIVEDNGPGPDPAWQEHLFDPFFSGRQAGRGRGLGLSKVWRIAELHAGRITWQRTPHRTTQFVLQLPRS